MVSAGDGVLESACEESVAVRCVASNEDGPLESDVDERDGSAW